MRLSSRPSSASRCMGRHVTLPRWKQSILRMGSFVFSGEPTALTPALPPFIWGSDSHWHYRLLQAHLKIIACMIAIFLTSLRRCSLCLGINGCSILDRGKAASFHVSVKGCIFSTIHFNGVRHAVLIYRALLPSAGWRAFWGSSEVCHAVVENRCIDLSYYPSPSLFVYYSFDSLALFCEVKYQKGPQFCYFRMDDPGDWGRISFVCKWYQRVQLWFCEHVLVWHRRLHTVRICMLFFLQHFKSQLCVSSSLHMKTHLTQ